MTTNTVNRTTLNRHRLCFAIQLYAQDNNLKNLYNVSVSLQSVLPYYVQLDETDSFDESQDDYASHQNAVKDYYNKQIKHKLYYTKTSNGVRNRIDLTCLKKEGTFPDIAFTHRLMEHPDGRCPSERVLSLAGGLGSQLTTIEDLSVDESVVDYFRQMKKYLPDNKKPFRAGDVSYGYLRSVFHQVTRLELHAEQIVFRKDGRPIYDVNSKPKPVEVNGNKRYWKSTTSCDYEIKIPYVTTSGLIFNIWFGLKDGTIEVQMRPYRRKKYAVRWDEYDDYLDRVFDVLYESLNIDYRNFNYDIVQYDLNNDTPIGQVPSDVRDMLELAFRQEGKDEITIPVEGYGVATVAVYKLERDDKGKCYRFEFRLDRKPVDYEQKGGTLGEITRIIDRGITSAVTSSEDDFRDAIRQSIDDAQQTDNQLAKLIGKVDDIDHIVNGVARTLVYFANETQETGEKIDNFSRSQERVESVVNYLLTEQAKTADTVVDSIDELRQTIDVDVISSLSSNLMVMIEEYQKQNEEFSEFRDAVTQIQDNTSRTTEAIELLSTNQANILSMMQRQQPEITKPVQYQQEVKYDIDQPIRVNGIDVPSEFVVKKSKDVESKTYRIKSDIIVSIISYLFHNGWSTEQDIQTNIRRRAYDINRALHAGKEMSYFRRRDMADSRAYEWDLTQETRRIYSLNRK